MDFQTYLAKMAELDAQTADLEQQIRAHQAQEPPKITIPVTERYVLKGVRCAHCGDIMMTSIPDILTKAFAGPIYRVREDDLYTPGHSFQLSGLNCHSCCFRDGTLTSILEPTPAFKIEWAAEGKWEVELRQLFRSLDRLDDERYRLCPFRQHCR